MTQLQYVTIKKEINDLMAKTSEHSTRAENNRLDYLWSLAEEYEKENQPVSLPTQSNEQKIKEKGGCLGALIYLVLIASGLYLLLSALI